MPLNSIETTKVSSFFYYAILASQLTKFLGQRGD